MYEKVREGYMKAAVFSGPLVQDTRGPGLNDPLIQQIFIVPPGSHRLELTLENQNFVEECRATLSALDMSMAFQAFSQYWPCVCGVVISVWLVSN